MMLDFGMTLAPITALLTGILVVGAVIMALAAER